MRPESFSHPIAPDVFKDTIAGSCTFRNRLMSPSGRTFHAKGTITKGACEFAGMYPHDTGPAVLGAVLSRGMTVVHASVLHRDMPVLDWIVHPDGVVPDVGTGD